MAMVNLGAFVYFVRAGDAVKIGVTTEPKSRMRSIATGSPAELQVLGMRWFPSEADAYAEERRIHGALAAHRVNGEWFRLGSDVLDAVADQQRGPALSAYNEETEGWRIERLRRVASRLPLASILELHDRKGMLAVTWDREPYDVERRLCAEAWGAEGNEPRENVGHWVAERSAAA